MFLAQSSFPLLGFIIDPIAKLMGYILDFIFRGLSSVGIVNLGLCIIIFTFIIKLFMLPMTIKQLKFSKMSAMVQPEVAKIQKKYKGKTDQASMMKQNEEIQAVYDKYGISMTGGCLQMFIQLPILMALYQVIRNLPFYIPQLKVLYTKIAEPLMQVNGFEDIMTSIGKDAKVIYKLTEPIDLDQVIGYICQFKTDSWAVLAEKIPSMADLIESTSKQIIEMHNFVAGINISDAPGFRISVYMLIPIAAAFFQWLSMKTMNTPSSDDNNPAAAMTKNMNLMMPLMSFVMCFSFPAGIGIYWAANALFQVLQQIAINKYMDRMDMEALIAKNMEKAAKKKKKPSLTQKMMEKVTGEEETPSGDGSITAAATTKTKNYSRNYDNGKNADDISYSNLQQGKPKPGSLAEKAGLVKDYNERNKKGGSR